MKRKINLNRPKISSEEIAQRKDFNSVMQNHGNIATKSLLKKPWFLSSVVVATVAVITTVVLLNKENTGTQSVSEQQTTNNQQLTTNNEQQITSNEQPITNQQPTTNRCIDPPLKGINVPYKVYKVNAEKGAVLDFKTGSKISIPKNAFADKNGNLLKGEVELRYREFHDPVDFFVSGIPMTYDSAGMRYHFESAGMMEMLAYQDGKQVNMTKGKSINIELASNYSGTEYNLYELDTVKNNWACLGKDKVKQIDKRQGDQFIFPDKSLQPVQQSNEYKIIETKKEEVQKEKEVKIAALPKTAEPKKPVQAKKDKYTFNIEVEANEYPELAVYKGLLFQVGDENKNFSASMYDITWDEASVKEGNKKGENYLLTLKKASKKYDLIVYPVFEGKNYETAMKEYKDKFVKYEKILEKRVAEEKKIEEEYQAKLLALKNQQEELERKWMEEQNNQFKRMNTEEKVKRVFAINRFGVFNCDQPSNYPQGVMCSANLTNERDAKLMCYEIFLVDAKRNGLFTYYKNPISRFSFNPQSTNMLWTVEDGVLYLLKPDDFTSIKKGNGLYNLKLARVDQKFNNVEELKAFLNF